MKRLWTRVITGVAALPLLCACSDNKPPKAPEAGANGAAMQAQARANRGRADQNVNRVDIDPRIAKLCNLSETQAHFAFDSAMVQRAAVDPLDALAKCFEEGPGKGKNLNIVGHCDPRGEEEYNFGLGQRRAGSIASYLARRGLRDNRYTTSSRGKLDATGSDETGWAMDRRVDILLAE